MPVIADGKVSIVFHGDVRPERLQQIHAGLRGHWQNVITGRFSAKVLEPIEEENDWSTASGAHFSPKPSVHGDSTGRLGR